MALAPRMLEVLGQIERLSFVSITAAPRSHGMVALEVEGPGGTVHATLTDDMVDALITMLREARADTKPPGGRDVEPF